MRSLEQWLAHQSQVHPQAIELGLERLQQVLERLHWRQPRLPVITVAGTNGKGSVSACAAAILSAAGYRVGTFTSPHLRDYRERIRIMDRNVSSGELLWAFEKIEAARGTLPLTFFEYNALAALLILKAAKLDAWVLEIGMGGRLDAVNAVAPTVAVVVSIGLDHQEFLGPDLAAIAREKAGILRKGVPAVLGSREMPEVIERIAHEVGARLKRPGIEYSFTRRPHSWHYRGPVWDLPDLPPPALWGDIQFANAATAIAAVEELEDRLEVSAAAVARGVASAWLLGRFQVIEPFLPETPTWILDVAHNPAAARVLNGNLRAVPAAGRTLAVCGILADKDAAGIAAELRESFDAWWLSATDGLRGSSAWDLKLRVAAQIRVPLTAVEGIGAACAAARAAAGAADRIVVFGSFHTVGPALDWLESHGMLPPTALPEYTAAPLGIPGP